MGHTDRLQKFPAWGSSCAFRMIQLSQSDGFVEFCLIWTMVLAHFFLYPPHQPGNLLGKSRRGYLALMDTGLTFPLCRMEISPSLSAGHRRTCDSCCVGSLAALGCETCGCRSHRWLGCWELACQGAKWHCRHYWSTFKTLSGTTSDWDQRY